MSRLRQVARQLVPPLLWRMAGSGRIRYAGRYASWAEAAAAARGYDDPAILERVAKATRDVLEGRAAGERDGCLLDRPDYRWPVLAALFWSAARSQGRLTVLDFGGSLGGTFLQLRPFLCGLAAVEWCVVEQPHFVERGRREFSVDGLRFFSTISECVAHARLSAALLSSVLQYLEDPPAVIRELCASGIRDIVIDRTLFAKDGQERICVQRVPASLGKTSYPCRLLSAQGLREAFAPTHRLVFQFEDDLDRPPRDGWFGGMVFSRIEDERG